MECTFCFLCLRGLRGRKSQFSGDAVQGVGRGRENGGMNSIKILMTYLLNTADNKYDSVLKGILKLTGVSRNCEDPAHNDGGVVDAGDELEGVGGTPKSLRKCFRMCHQCEVVAEKLLDLHLELEKVQMKIVQEVKTVRESIQKSSGWLGGTAIVNESEEAFENFARRFFDGDLTTKARGTFGFLKTFQTAVVDIDKTAILVPLVFLERCAITQKFHLLAATGCFKTDPNDEDDPMELEPCQDDEANSISFDPDPADPGYHFSDDNNDSDFSVDAFVSNSSHVPVSTAQDPNWNTSCSQLSAQATENMRSRRGLYGRKKKGGKGWARHKNSAYTRQLQSIITRPPSPLPQRRSQVQQQPQPYRKSRPKSKPKPKPIKKSKVSTGRRKISTPRSPSEFYPDFDPDEDIEFESVPEEDVKDSEYIPGRKIGPYKKKPKSHSERLVQSAKRRRGRPSMLQNMQPSKMKPPSKNGDETGEKRKPGRPINPGRRVNGKFACESCSFINKQICRMEQHLRGHETEEKVFKCEPCSIGFSNEQHYRLHEGRHRGHNRVRCEVDACHRYVSIFEIADHLKRHPGVDQIFPCPYCTHFLPSLGMHMAHLRKYHAAVEWKCLICGEIFKKMTELGDHLQETHQAVQKSNCSYEDCDRSYYDPKSLRAHLKIHGMKFGCAKCDRCFSGQETFDFHQEVHRTGKPYKCDLDNCSEAFRNHTSLRKHKVDVHQIEKQVCELCGKEFRNSTGLKGHMMASHGIGEGKACPVCNKLFASENPLRSHMEQAHSTSKNYICEDCGKAFKTMNKCNHHRQIHGERNYQCPHCDKAFRQRPSLRDHIRIHTGEKPYVCRKCGMAFRQAGTRKKHENICQLSSSSQETEQRKHGGGRAGT